MSHLKEINKKIFVHYNNFVIGYNCKRVKKTICIVRQWLVNISIFLGNFVDLNDHYSLEY